MCSVLVFKLMPSFLQNIRKTPCGTRADAKRFGNSRQYSAAGTWGAAGAKPSRAEGPLSGGGTPASLRPLLAAVSDGKGRTAEPV